MTIVAIFKLLLGNDAAPRLRADAAPELFLQAARDAHKARLNACVPLALRHH